MKKTAYGKPILLDKNEELVKLEKIEAFNELFIQDLIFKHPDCLPISEIDESFNPLVPVCTELNTPAGPLDIFMITPNGEIIIIETKLWRNPGARREVIGQILDYAKEISNWSYADLQREISKKLGIKGNTLYELAKRQNPDLTPPESDFVDSVSRNLSRGKFLLLIAGDGIKEGAFRITEFLSNAGHLNFTFAMVELNIYQGEGAGTLVIPKTIVKTVEIPKLIIEIPEGLKISNDHEAGVGESKANSAKSPEKAQESAFYIKFWKEFVRELNFDDPGQPLPNPASAQNLYVYPAKTKRVWVSAFFSKSKKRIGVYFRAENNQLGNEILSFLDDYKDEMRQEFGDEIIWNWEESNDITIRMGCENIFAAESREEIKEFFSKWLNTFVNVLRPRLQKFEFQK